MKLGRNRCKLYFLGHMESIKVADELSTSTDWHHVPVNPLECLNKFSIDILSIRKRLLCRLKGCGINFLAGWAGETHHAPSLY